MISSPPTLGGTGAISAMDKRPLKAFDIKRIPQECMPSFGLLATLPPVGGDTVSSTLLKEFVFFCQLWPTSGWPLAHRWFCFQRTKRQANKAVLLSTFNCTYFDLNETRSRRYIQRAPRRTKRDPNRKPPIAIPGTTRSQWAGPA